MVIMRSFHLSCSSLSLFVSVVLSMIAASSRVAGNEGSDLFSRASCEFSLNLLKSQTKLKEGNVVLSPSSVGILLAILQQGAKENSSKQLEKVLLMSADDSKLGHSLVLKSLQREKSNVTLEWGNRGYIRPGFELADEFNKTIREIFGAVIEELDFVNPSPQEAANVVNNWVKEVTHGNIVNLIPPSVLTPDTAFILLNAVFFKGLWDLPFKKSLTKLDTFESSQNNSIQVEFMSQRDRFIAGEDPESGILWVDLPFKDEQFSMLFILPKERHALDSILEKLGGALLRSIIDDDQTRQVTLHIPKFKLNEKVLLAGALKELGLVDIFTADANLEGISPNYKHLGVSKIIHQASLEIDEDGGTASAATGLVLEVLSFPKASDNLIFKADHPFLFFLLDRTNKIPLFVGKVADPGRQPSP